MFADLETDARIDRAHRRSERLIAASTRPQTRGAFLSTCLAFALFVSSPIITTGESYYSSPNNFSDPTPRFHSYTAFHTHTTDTPSISPNDHYNSLFSHFQHSELYALVSIVLPAGTTPKTVDQALTSVDARHWRFALDSEYDQLTEALTWDLVPRNEASNIVTGKWIFKIKHNADGSIDRYKARWVARGFSQRYQVDYTEVFAPVVRYSSVRLLLSLANSYGLQLFGLDVSNAFARADVDEQIFVEQPHGYVQRGSNGVPYVCRLRKGLYGTKQAARLWNQKFRKFLLVRGWRQLESDPCIYTRHTHTHGWEIIGLYVDDIIHACHSSNVHSALLTECQSEFPTTSQGELSWILGMHITRDFQSKTLSLDQTQSILAFLDDWDITPSGKVYATPMDDQWHYGNEPVTSDPKEIERYRSQMWIAHVFFPMHSP